MRLHHSIILPVEYFLSYAQLVINSRELSVEETQLYGRRFL